jgi:EpsI family protein
MTAPSPAIRFGTATLLLMATAGFVYWRRATERLPEHSALSAYPMRSSDWSGADLAIPADVREMLGNGDFLLREYRENNTGAPVELFIAYFPSQRSGESIHSPKNCLPGSGWFPLEASRTPINIAGRSPFVVNRYVVANGLQRRLVLYWYQSRNRTIASEYQAKLYLAIDALRYNRSDGALVRFTTPIAPEEKIESADRRLLDFSAIAVPELDHFLPR